MHLGTFIAEGPGKFIAQAAWVEQAGFKCLYLRWGRFYIKHQMVPDVFQIATIEAMIPGAGAFTRLVEELKKLKCVLYVENANPEFSVALRKYGWKLASSDGLSACWYFDSHLEKSPIVEEKDENVVS